MVVILFFFLKDGAKIWNFFLRPFKGEREAKLRRVGSRTLEVLGGALAAAFGAALLAMPAAALIGTVVRLFDPIAYAVSLLSIVSACACAALIPALRAARINPVAALRQD